MYLYFSRQHFQWVSTPPPSHPWHSPRPSPLRPYPGSATELIQFKYFWICTHTLTFNRSFSLVWSSYDQPITDGWDGNLTHLTLCIWYKLKICLKTCCIPGHVLGTMEKWLLLTKHTELSIPYIYCSKTIEVQLLFALYWQSIMIIKLSGIKNTI